MWWPFTQVEIVGEEYLCQGANLQSQEEVDRLNNIISQFTLNEEQERAFRIVTQHALLPQSEQLRMYLGGITFPKNEERFLSRHGLFTTV